MSKKKKGDKDGPIHPTPPPPGGGPTKP